MNRGRRARDFEKMTEHIITDELAVQGYVDIMRAWIKAELDVHYGDGSID